MSGNDTSSNDTDTDINPGNTNCYDLIDYGQVPAPDNDISGIGVILAFIISAYITLAIVTLAYFCGYIDHTLLRPVDIYVHKRSAHRAHKSNAWYIAIRQCTLAFSDQQIVTGIAILIAGFIGFANSMTVYHFQIVIYLGWMSSSVHLSALTMLGSFLRERRALLGWRVGGMITMFILLMVALFPTLSNDWAVNYADDAPTPQWTDWGIPAKCFWLETYGDGINADGPLGIVLLTVSYIWKVGALFESPRAGYRTYVRGPVEYRLELWLHRLAKKQKSRPTHVVKVLYWIVMGVYTTVFANFEFFASFAASLWLSIAGLTWGTIQIVIPRIQNSWWAYQENTWSFGQITPLILLIQPIGAVLEHVGEGARQHREHASQDTLVRDRGSGRRRSKSTEPWRRRRAGTITRTQKLSDIFADLEPKKSVDRSTGDLLGHQRILYNSWYFCSLIAWIQLTVIVSSGLVLVQNAETIGNDNSANWQVISLSICGLFGWSLVWLIICIPFSRVFR